MVAEIINFIKIIALIALRQLLLNGFSANEKLSICTVLINAVKMACKFFVIAFFHIVPPLRSQRMQAVWTLVDGKRARVSVNA